MKTTIKPQKVFGFINDTERDDLKFSEYINNLTDHCFIRKHDLVGLYANREGHEIKDIFGIIQLAASHRATLLIAPREAMFGLTRPLLRVAGNYAQMFQIGLYSIDNALLVGGSK